MGVCNIIAYQNEILLIGVVDRKLYLCRKRVVRRALELYMLAVAGKKFAKDSCFDFDWKEVGFVKEDMPMTDDENSKWNYPLPWE
jgi:hypothetical protein